MKQSSSPPSKLLIRSEVLAVIEYLSVVSVRSKQDKQKQYKRLSAIPDRKAVLDILIKELRRLKSNTEGVTGENNTLQAITELLMELGDIESLHEPLWNLIRNEDAPDDIKDAANLTLRHLGDETDPDLYLDYLEDPQGLITRETKRMLEVASKNPEALIDFIDFIFSLPNEEQIALLASLQEEYAPEHIEALYAPILLAQPCRELQEQILKWLGKSRLPHAAWFIANLLQDNPIGMDEALQKIAKRSLNELKLAGVIPADFSAVSQLPEIVLQSKPYACYMTISDGIGNQGVILSRRSDNGDISMMSVVINDLHGVIDCFGFYQLSEVDYQRIMEKFHEESVKIPVSPAYCLHKLLTAEALNIAEQNRIPYEYTCWKALLSDIESEPVDTFAFCREHANPEWRQGAEQLFNHPDFSTWFLEEGDHPVVTEVFLKVSSDIMSLEASGDSHEALSSELKATFLTHMETAAELLTRSLMATEWRHILTQRLADTAYLMHCQGMETFSTLAATEVVRMLASEDPSKNSPPQNSTEASDAFTLQYGRRCVEEYLLRLKHKPDISTRLSTYIDFVLAEWEV